MQKEKESKLSKATVYPDHNMAFILVLCSRNYDINVNLLCMNSVILGNEKTMGKNGHFCCINTVPNTSMNPTKNVTTKRNKTNFFIKFFHLGEYAFFYY